tara:strand:+ start:1519 stop:2148 length:630 start_codon:yes stop_codon:yes gene_type:complete
MSSLSVKKLGGLALIVGPILTLVAYQLTPGVLGDFEMVGNHVAVQMEAAESVGMAEFSGLLLVAAMLVMLFGFNSLSEKVRGGNGEALFRLGLLPITAGILMWITGAAVYLAIANGMPTPNAAQAGLTSLGEISFAAGVVVIGLALLSRDDFNKIALGVFVAAGILSLVLNIFSSQLSLDAQIHGILISITYIIWVVWAVIVGLSQIKE